MSLSNYYKLDPITAAREETGVINFTSSARLFNLTFLASVLSGDFYKIFYKRCYVFVQASDLLSFHPPFPKHTHTHTHTHTLTHRRTLPLNIRLCDTNCCEVTGSPLFTLAKRLLQNDTAPYSHER